MQLSRLSNVTASRPKTAIGPSAPVVFASQKANELSRVIGIDTLCGMPLDVTRSDMPGVKRNALTKGQQQLELEYNRPYVIGRAQGCAVDYLAPGYQVTRTVPGTSKEISVDGMISRAHFQLIATHEGLKIIDGVPSPGGGIRRSKNGVFLLEPENKRIHDFYLVEPGKQAKIRIGENTILLLNA